MPPLAEDLLAQDFERLGRLPYKAGLSLQRAQEGWFSLTGSELHAIFPEGPWEEPLQLRKLQELCAWIQLWGPNLQGTRSWAPRLPPPPWKSECYPVTPYAGGWVPWVCVFREPQEGASWGP